MAPRTRSNRAEKLAVQKLLSNGFAVNASGFPALPNELYWEILGYLPALPIPHVVEKMDPLRQLTLYYLSHTCRSLRKFFLRYAWERIEVFRGMRTPVGRLATKAEMLRRGTDMRDLVDKKLLDEILRQLETVTVRNPDLRQYVSIVNLTIPKYSHKEVFPRIAQNLSLFPNLHSLQLISYRPPQQVFSAFRYPSVHTLSLTRMGLHELEVILHACPNTRQFSFYKRVGFHIRFLLHKECARSIEKLGALKGLKFYLNDMVKCLPRLRDLSLDTRTLRDSGELLTRLSPLPLHTIRLRMDYRLRPHATPNEVQSWIGLAKKLLAKCPQHEVAKKLIVMKDDKTVDVYSVEGSGDQFGHGVLSTT